MTCMTQTQAQECVRTLIVELEKNSIQRSRLTCDWP